MNPNNLDRDVTPEFSLGRSNTEYFIRGEIVAICNAVIGNYIEVLAAACELNRLGFELFGELDEGFEVFAAVCSEVEDLPIGKERENWAPEALAEKDNEIRRAAAMYSDSIREACKSLLTRLAPYAPSLFE